MTYKQMGDFARPSVVQLERLQRDPARVRVLSGYSETE